MPISPTPLCPTILTQYLDSWCMTEKSTCPLICQQTPPGTTLVNDCDAVSFSDHKIISDEALILIRSPDRKHSPTAACAETTSSPTYPNTRSLFRTSSARNGETSASRVVDRTTPVPAPAERTTPVVLRTRRGSTPHPPAHNRQLRQPVLSRPTPLVLSTPAWLAAVTAPARRPPVTLLSASARAMACLALSSSPLASAWASSCCKGVSEWISNPFRLPAVTP